MGGGNGGNSIGAALEVGRGLRCARKRAIFGVELAVSDSAVRRLDRHPWNIHEDTRCLVGGVGVRAASVRCRVFTGRELDNILQRVAAVGWRCTALLP
jgi:hypothetical protein